MKRKLLLELFTTEKFGKNVTIVVKCGHKWDKTGFIKILYFFCRSLSLQITSPGQYTVSIENADDQFEWYALSLIYRFFKRL